MRLDVFLNTHAVDEFKRHMKTGGTLEDVFKSISHFFSVNPHLVQAKTFTLQRSGKQPRFKGTTTFLARGSWRLSKVLLILVSDNGVYTTVTTLSGREFKIGVKKKRIIDISEKPVREDIHYQMVSARS